MQKHLKSNPKFKKAHKKSKRAPGPQKNKHTPEAEATRKIEKKIERELAARAVKFNETLEIVKGDIRHFK
jgi:hypothetical protein